MIAIVSAFPKETALLRAKGQSIQRTTLNTGGKLFSYVLEGIPIITLSLGMGVDTALVKTEELLSQYPKISHLILTGVAGGFSPHAPGSVLIPTAVTLWNNSQVAPIYSLHGESGLLVTTRTVVEHELSHEIQKVYPEAVGVDMEGAVVAETCFRHGVGCTIIRGVSDLVDSPIGSNTQYQQYRDLALEKTAESVLLWITSHGRDYL